MKRIDEWVRENLELTEQKIIARQGIEIADTDWSLEKEGLRCELYSEHSAYIWMMLDSEAEATGKRPLQILDDYGMKCQSWPCSPEGFARVALYWAIEEQCRQNCPDWK